MTSHIQVQLGREPWLPSEDSVLVGTRHFWDVPQIGVLRQREVPYLFASIIGGADGVGIWAYVALTDSEASEFLSLPQEMVRADVRRLLIADAVVVAAVLNHRIFWLCELDRQPDVATMLRAAQSAIESVRSSLATGIDSAALV